ncbi:preprotein translocase subunit SecA, partial [bacterium]|nr:preprotein translocase subunit SecA [bacterium]
MLSTILKLVLGTKSQRDIKKLKPLVDQINAFESKYEKFSDEELRGMTDKFKKEVQDVVNPLYASIDELRKTRNYDEEEFASLQKNVKKELDNVLSKILPDAFAVVREAGKRALKMRHFDVQLMGGIVLHEGKIAEMSTGEGKTLVATLPAYLNALAGRGAHVVTVNDYLAQRDRDWMGTIYEFLGLTVGCIKHGISNEERRRSYNCDITYGTNNEFGFDYLRDNMVSSLEERVQRPRHFCIVDEVDSILIDEARTPLIISGAVETVSYCYDEIKSQVRDLVNKQTTLINDFLKHLDNAIEKEDEDEIKKWLYLIHRGAPKDKVFLTKIINNPKLKKILEVVTVRFAAKDMVAERLKLEEGLFYIFEEKTREVVLTQKGEFDLSNNYPGQFELEDITSMVSEIQGDETLSDEEKAIKEKTVYDKYEDKGKRIRSFEQLLKAYVLFQIDVDYVVKDNKVIIVD